MGIAGAGYMATVHADAWKALGHRPVAVLTRGSSTSTSASDLLNTADRYTDLSQFLASVDIVDLCLPTHLHAEYAIAAARAERPTFCEKPLSLTSDACGQVRDAFERAGVPLGIGHVVRFIPEYRAARQAVVNGELGATAVLRLSRLSFPPERGDDPWFRDESKSGGIFFDLMIHDLDYARWTAGEVATIYARTCGQDESHAIAILTHENGTLSYVEASWAYPPPTFRTSLEICGEAAMLTYDSEDNRELTATLPLAPPASKTGMMDFQPQDNPFVAELRNFLNVVRGTEEAMVSVADACAAVELAAGAAESAHSDQVVRLRPRTDGVVACG